ncbi:unnamed protein product, partial [Ranitomeya imitator]
KLDVSSTSPGSLYPSRSATPSRYIASRAIQRSLAIIRQAQQKKEKKEYCMYYNRFGKCNRGQKCPYIHDPEKVAVCTRFLRGTCKKIDGTCPFSHQVSKDKCKKKHTLLCPDYARDGKCPQGSKCKLQHRQRKRRLDVAAQPEPTPSSAKQRRSVTQQTGVRRSTPCCARTTPATANVLRDPNVNCSTAREKKAAGCGGTAGADAKQRQAEEISDAAD